MHEKSGTKQMTETTSVSVMEFPCQFPIKAMGSTEHDIQSVVWSIVQRHVPDLHTDQIYQRPSKGGRYVSITITIEAHSRAQLDAIYYDLTACEQILMAL